MLNVYYPYIESKWGEELKYSIRSLEQYFKENFRIIILGNPPKYLNSSKIVIYEENYINNVLNQYGYPISDFKMPQSKHFFACMNEKENSEYLWMMDDVYFLNDIDTNVFRKNYIVQDLTGIKNRNNSKWGKKLWSTADYLKSHGYSIYNFETHIPYLYNSSKMRETFEFFSRCNSWLINTAYHNYHKYINNLELIKDKRLGFYGRKKDIPNNINNYLFLNHDDNGLSNKLKTLIINRFNKKSKYEK
jgi:hypothetical protein